MLEKKLGTGGEFAATHSTAARRGVTRVERDRFEQLFLPERERLLAYLAGMTGDREAALDAAQEAFLAAWRDIETFREESVPLTWLIGIARRIVFRESRRERRREELRGGEPARHGGTGSAARDGDAETNAARDEEPGGAIEARERDARVRAATLLLPRERREAVVLHYFAGMSVAEIATALRTREGTIKSRLARARAELSKRLESDL